jgi:hypothetical protein
MSEGKDASETLGLQLCNLQIRRRKTTLKHFQRRTSREQYLSSLRSRVEGIKRVLGYKGLAALEPES